MPNVMLTSEEAAVLRQVVERTLADLEHEILHTDHIEFRDMLKHRRHLLSEIRERLPASVGTDTGR
jgi:hypothetical protein